MKFMAAKKQYIIGVDTGGTFTDVVVLGVGGEVWTAKASTTPDDFSRGVMDGVEEAARTVEDRGALSQFRVLSSEFRVLTTRPETRDPRLIRLRGVIAK